MEREVDVSALVRGNGVKMLNSIVIKVGEDFITWSSHGRVRAITQDVLLGVCVGTEETRVSTIFGMWVIRVSVTL